MKNLEAFYWAVQKHGIDAHVILEHMDAIKQSEDLVLIAACEQILVANCAIQSRMDDMANGILFSD